jgi:hypothetical protein
MEHKDCWSDIVKWGFPNEAVVCSRVYNPPTTRLKLRDPLRPFTPHNFRLSQT